MIFATSHNKTLGKVIFDHIADISISIIIDKRRLFENMERAKSMIFIISNFSTVSTAATTHAASTNRLRLRFADFAYPRFVMCIIMIGEI